ncbi:MAG: hypothetical protein ACE5FR_03960 [Rhodospirillales bacterium]
MKKGPGNVGYSGIRGFSGPLVEAVARHHDPRRSHCPEVNALTAVHAARHLSREERAATDARELAVPLLDRLPAWDDFADSFTQERIA